VFAKAGMSSLLIDRLPEIFGEIWTPEAVHVEIMVSDKSGYDVPTLSEYSWLRIINPKAQPSEWLSELAKKNGHIKKPYQLVVVY